MESLLITYFRLLDRMKKGKKRTQETKNVKLEFNMDFNLWYRIQTCRHLDELQQIKRAFVSSQIRSFVENR